MFCVIIFLISQGSTHIYVYMSILLFFHRHENVTTTYKFHKDFIRKFSVNRLNLPCFDIQNRFGTIRTVNCHKPKPIVFYNNVAYLINQPGIVTQICALNCFEAFYAPVPAFYCDDIFRVIPINAQYCIIVV